MRLSFGRDEGSRGRIGTFSFAIVLVACLLVAGLLAAAPTAGAATIPYAPADLWTYANPYPSEHSFVSTQHAQRLRRLGGDRVRRDLRQ